MKIKTILLSLIGALVAVIALSCCSDDNDFDRKFVKGSWEEAAEKTSEYSLVYDFQTPENTESWGDLNVYKVYSDGSFHDNTAFSWHIYSEPGKPKEMTLALSPKDKADDDDAWLYTEHFDIVKLTAKEMWLKNTKANGNSSQLSYKATIKLTRYTAK